MSRLAADWGQWASDCESRAQRPGVAPTEVTLTVTDMTGQSLWAQRIDVTTGEPLVADVLPLRGASL